MSRYGEARRFMAVALLCGIAMASPALGQESSGLTAQGPDEPVLLGDWFELAVHLPEPAEGIEPVGSSARLEGFPPSQPRGVGRVVRRDGRLQAVIPVQADRVGEMVLSGLTLMVDEIEALPIEPVKIVVVLDLPGGRLPRVAPPRPSIVVPMPVGKIWPFVLTLLVALGLIGRGVARVARLPVVPETVDPPPHEVAIRELAGLRSRLPRELQEMPLFVVAVSGVVRRYIEGQFDVAAPDRTTEEFLSEVADRNDALGDRQEMLNPFLLACDLVKFAAHSPELDQATSLLETAERFVEETRHVSLHAESEEVEAS